MKRITLQWRLTLMTAFLVAAACLLLSFSLNFSAILRMNELEDSIIRIRAEDDSATTFSMSISDLYPEISDHIQESKDTFRMQSLGATLAVILLGSAVTYLLAGKALEPLHRFSSHMEEIEAQNLLTPMEVPDTEDEISRLTRSFNGMLLRLNQAFETQRQFSANAAHELRTPLAVIQTNLDVFQKRQCPTEKEYRETFDRLQEQTGRLSHLVEILLEMTELQTAGRTDPISLDALAEEVLCDLAPVAEKKGVTLSQSGEAAELIGNDTLLYRAVYNLVENAIKYNRPGGRVTIDIRQMEKMAVLVVSDTGIGIAPEDWEKIFDPFFRVDKSRSRAMGGAGLGLALVRDIARQHGGEVRIIRSEELGTEIALELPR